MSCLRVAVVVVTLAPAVRSFPGRGEGGQLQRSLGLWGLVVWGGGGVLSAVAVA